MTEVRVIEPEWLDELPHEDPRAQRSRRDLARVNALMGNARIVAGELARLPAPGSIAEIGAGDGAFMRAVLRRLGSPNVELHLVDRQPLGVTPGAASAAEPAPAVSKPGARGPINWTTADVFDWLSDPRGQYFDAVVANLFLHHFESSRVARLFALAAKRCDTFIACEPRRSTVAAAGSRLLGLVGCNDVTRHDAVVSIRAGFSGHELSALWPAEGGWSLEERARGPFSHAFVARRP